VGGRLLRALEARGERVRCLVRRPEVLSGRVGPLTEVAKGDVLSAEGLWPALEGVETAFYLIHSMGSGGDFEEKDRIGARNFAEAARGQHLRRIVYLGGLGDPGEDLSPHLRSRHEVGEILRSSGIAVLELQASIVLGAGSLSFEMIRALVERLPVMITPRWVDVPAQPIGIDDLIQYLVEAIDVPLEGSRIVEIGGPDQVSYGGLMREYARQRGLHRALVRVPVLTPHLSGLWLGLVTPLYARVGRKLIESIRHPTIVRDRSAARMFHVRPMAAHEAIACALREEDARAGGTRWCDAVSSAGEPRSWAGVRFGHRFLDFRTIRTPAPPSRAFEPIRRIGGRNGWYAFNWLWRLRGFLDLVIGGVGLRRGRPSSDMLHVGDPLDFWRVEAFEPDRLLRLSAEMKLPGRAWLEFVVEPSGSGSEIRQTAIFDPVGLGGLAYWYLIYPVHALVFSGMLKAIARRAVGPVERPSP
jgi:uncharacterized protein YbjT (DUF2867 family)